MGDPGISFKCATLHATWKLLGFPATQVELPEAAEDAVEEMALAGGMRSRRVLLDGAWWKQAALPMLARVSDRRRR